MEEIIRIVLEAVSRSQGELEKVQKQIQGLNDTNKKSEGIFARTGKAIRANEAAFKAVGVAAAAASAAIVALLTTSLRTADAFNRQANSLGTTAERLSALAFAAKQADIDQSQLAGSLNFLNRAIAESQDASSGAAKAFDALQISTKGLADEDPTEVLLRVAQAFSETEGAAAKAQIAQELFGKGSRDFVAFLNEGAVAARALGEEGKALGAVFSNDTAKRADELGDNIEKLKAAFLGVGNEALAILLPDLIKLSQVLLENVKQGGFVREGAIALIAVFKTVAQITIFLVQGFRALGVVLGQGLALSFEVNVRLIQAFIEHIRTLGRNIAALLNAVFELVKAIGGLGKVFSSLAKGEFTAAAAAARDAVGGIGDKAQAVADSFTKVFTDTGAIVEKTATDITGTVTTITTSAFNDLAGLGQQTIDLLNAVSGEGQAIAATAEAGADKAGAPKRKLAPLAKAGGEPESVQLAQTQAEIASTDAEIAATRIDAEKATGAEIRELHRLQLEAQAEDEQAAYEALAAKNIQNQELLAAMNLSIYRKGQLERAKIDQQQATAEKRLGQNKLQASAAIFQGLNNLAIAAGAEGFAAQKAFAIATATVNTILGVTQALGAAPPPYSFVLAAIVGALGAVQIAKIAGVSFAEGGLVPGRPSSTDNRLAAVATGEYVMPANIVRDYGAGFFEAIRRGKSPLGFSSGGIVARPMRGSSFQSGGLVGATLTLQEQIAAIEETQTTTVAVINTRQQMREFQKAEGTRIVSDALGKRSNQVVT